MTGLTLNQEGKLNALVVEDNMANQFMAKYTLEKTGYEVECASDGLEATELLKNHLYDVVFMDIHIPHEDGISVTRKTKLNPGVNQHTPIVAMTASGDEMDLLRCIDAGMVDSVPKPMSRGDVERVTRKIQSPLDHLKSA